MKLKIPEINLPDKTRFNILCILVGVLAATASILLKTIVYYIAHFVRTAIGAGSFNFLYFTLPIIGIILTVLFVKYFVRDSLAHGITKALFAISKCDSKLPHHNNYTSIIAGALTVGFGGSVGLEAPIVLTGSSIGSSIAQLFHLNYRTRTLLLGCGAAAAVASIFKAPIAGTIFALEVLMIEMNVASLIPLLISAVTGSLLSALFLGQNVVFGFAVFEQFNIYNSLYYVVLGLFCGIVGLYFTLVMEFVENRFSKFVHPITKIAVGGILLGLIIYLVPPLYGEGYESLSHLFSEHPSMLLDNSLFDNLGEDKWLVLLFLFLIILLKPFASSLTTGAGGVGGVFGPSLFLGGISGYLFSGVVNNLELGVLSQRNFSLVGMAGVLSAIMQSPLTAIFLIAEITGGYTLFAPIIITTTVAYITIHRFEKYSVYTKRLANKGELLTHDKDKAVLTLLKFEDVLETDFKTVNVCGFLGDLIKEVSHSSRNTFIVLNDDGDFMGLISLDDIRSIMFDEELYEQIKVDTIMHQPVGIVQKSDTAEDVMAKFNLTGAWNLPVVEGTKYIGCISRSKMLTSYRDLLVEVSLK
ncbi:MAG: chloride channel protein [Ignavibacteria bacterium]|jgi:CIC family chloride channel protein|nr:chloride channel protein [Ignavibacteria bacterium]